MGMDGKFGTGVRSRGAARNGAVWERTLGCRCIRTGGGTTGAGGPSTPPPRDRAMCLNGHGWQPVISSRLLEPVKKGSKK